ncbi:MAG: hypothetical protein ACLT0R_04275 [Paraclostridium sordellii]
MNILKEFFDIFNITSYNISERIKVLDSKFNINGKNLPPIQDIQCILKKFPQRDNVKITLCNEYEDTVVFSNKYNTTKGYDLNDFYEENKQESDIIIRLEIKKDILNNVISVYNFNEFSTHIKDKPLIQIIDIFHGLLLDKEYIIFELFDSTLLFSTNTMIFKSYPAINIENRFQRLEKINICKQISSFYNISEYNLIPEDFEIRSGDNNNIFEPIFLKLKTLFSIIYISNTSIINGSNLSIEIVGQRKMSFNYDINNDIVNNDELYKIYSWISTDGNAIDKSIIARNIISLHCQFTDIIKTDQKTFSSIQSNFRLYQKDNVGQYIELKNKVGEFILNIVDSTSDIVIALSDKLKGNIIACFSFLFTAILANIVSDKPLDNIFTKDITFILEFVLLGSLFYMIISVMEMNYKLKKIKVGYDDLKQNYNNILDEKDISEIFKDDKIFNNNIEEVNRNRKILVIIWIVLLLACLVGIESVSRNPIILPMLKKGFYGFLILIKSVIK